MKLRSLIAALALFATPNAFAGTYYSYPSGAQPSGPEIIGPVRQGGADVTLTVSQILASWSPGLYATAGTLTGSELLPVKQSGSTYSVALNLVGAYAINLAFGYSAVSSLSGSEVFPIQVGGTPGTATTTQIVALAQKAQSAGFTDANTTGNAFTVTPTGQTNPDFVVDRTAGTITQGYTAGHQGYRTVGKLVTSNTGSFTFAPQTTGTGSMFYALTATQTAVITGAITCMDGAGDRWAVQVNAAWYTDGSANISQLGTPTTTVIGSSGTVTGWAISTGALGSATPALKFSGAASVYCTAIMDEAVTATVP